MKILNKETLLPLLKPRAPNAHKGNFGHVLIVGSGMGMPGATALAAQAAMRVGAGAVTILTSPHYGHSMVPGLPEVMISGIHHAQDLKHFLNKATVCILGPGLGEDEWAQEIYSHVIHVSCPLLVDASALRFLSKSPHKNSHWILTPHPGEAAALLACAVEDVQRHRVESIQRLQQDYHGTIVLKGHETLILDTNQDIYQCKMGNPGMATAGMGDVLSGVIGGLLAQGLSPFDAASLGVYLHAQAGDQAAAARGERGLMSSDLMPFLQQLSNPKLHLCP